MGPELENSSAGRRVSVSMEIFKRHVQRNPENGELNDVVGIISRPCYEEWLASRKTALKNPDLTFVQTVRGHLTGDPRAGCCPFEPDVEEKLIELLKKKAIWPCFFGTASKYGSRGMKLIGYHEKKRNGLGSPSSTSSRGGITNHNNNLLVAHPSKRLLRSSSARSGSSRSRSTTPRCTKRVQSVKNSSSGQQGLDDIDLQTINLLLGPSGQQQQQQQATHHFNNSNNGSGSIHLPLGQFHSTFDSDIVMNDTNTTSSLSRGSCNNNVFATAVANRGQEAFQMHRDVASMKRKHASTTEMGLFIKELVEDDDSYFFQPEPKRAATQHHVATSSPHFPFRPFHEPQLQQPPQQRLKEEEQEQEPVGHHHHEHDEQDLVPAQEQEQDQDHQQNFHHTNYHDHSHNNMISDGRYSFCNSMMYHPVEAVPMSTWFVDLI